METWDQYLERNGAFKDYVSTEGFKHLEQRYFNEVKRRIGYCEKLLTRFDEALIHYTLAELFNRSNLDESPQYLYKRPVRYHCIKAIRKNPDYPPLWALLAEAYDWVAELGGESKTMPTMDAKISRNEIAINVEHKKNAMRHKPTIFFIEKAIRYLKKSVSLEPENMRYQYRLKGYYGRKAKEIT